MSSEIISVEEYYATFYRKKREYLAQHSSEICAIQPWDLLNSGAAFNPKFSFDLIGGGYHTKEYLASEKGHKYVRQLNPTLASVKPLFDKIKEPSVLLLRGCELLLESPGFTFDKFKSIVSLEISGCPHLTTLPENTLSQMTHLQSLDLSYLPIDQLPIDLFENVKDSLRSLVLRGCSNLLVLPEPHQPLNMLEYLDLSHLPIETLPGAFLSYQLRSIILRGCFKLHSLQVSKEELHFLDLCHCTSLTTLDIPSTISVIDFSYTTLDWYNVPPSASHIFFKNANVCNLDDYVIFLNMKVCDLSGNQGIGDVSTLGRCYGLEALNLSKTAIESIDFLSKLTYMRTLVLSECTRLKQLPTFEQLECLEVLDLSRCEILGDLPEGLNKQRKLKELNLCGCKGLAELREDLFDDMLCLEKLDLSSTNIKTLRSFSNLIINHGTAINHSCDSALESSTVPLELTNLCRDNADSRQELHLVSTFICNSGFDNFKFRFTELNAYLFFLEEKITKSVVDTEASGVKRQFQSMHFDLEYIVGKVDLLESSQNCRSSEELLHQLMSYDYDNYDDDDSSIFKKLLRTVAKLKILVPPLPPKPLSLKEGKKESSTSGYECSSFEMRNRTDDYESLTAIQRNCLLYFACLPEFTSGKKMVKEHILIHLWYGEGFFDPLLSANSTSNLIPEMRCGSPNRNDLNQQVSTSHHNNTIWEIGRGIMRALKGSIFIVNQRQTKRWYVNEEDSSFLIKKAMEEHSFDFNKRGKLTPHFNVSRRACLLKSDVDHLPSSRVWLN